MAFLRELATNARRRPQRRLAPLLHDRPTEIPTGVRVFLARLLAAYGPAAPDLLRRIADELEWLEQERLNGNL